ncbi:dinucleotide-utilizing enzyme [Microbacterium sp. LRZ72]|uniref:dinucleotide-utilizing enzyme n=1 Tax=Microbacterium sp. LRZ72 TaxID=2942481 RepID=UPI0029A805C2|nr:dinucleotide-utilizing enzyme [Microbacterium sp. LRZ72]MDX2375271.1 dinucleotide-utilizing enzyme [Microbacterium sp. LRZ72]
MTIRPRLSRSIPFWILLVGSALATALGAWFTFDTLGTMSTTLLDGTATGVDVYVGQVWAVFGAILLASGLIGFALALTLGAASTLLRPTVAALTDAEPEAVSVPDQRAETSALETSDARDDEPAEQEQPLTHDEPAIQDGTTGATPTRETDTR